MSKSSPAMQERRAMPGPERPVEVTIARAAVRAEKPAPEGEPTVRVRDLSVRFKSVEALCGVSLDVHAGEHVAILGASGSGKTTLLKCLAHRLSPAAGSVSCSGRVATIHQDLGLVRQASAVENVLHGALGRVPAWRAAWRMPATERARAVELLRAVGLEHRVHHRVRVLSGGEQQRVAIARALMQEPGILLADEPVAALDDATAEAVMRLLREQCSARGITLVSVLHQTELASRFADRVIRLENGRLAPCDGHTGAADECCSACASCGSPMPGAGVKAPCPPSAGSGAAAGPRFEDPLRSRGWAFAAIAAALVLVYAWSVAGLKLSAGQVGEAAAGMWGFVRSLVPASWGQLTGLPWATLTGSLIETIQMSIIGTSAGIVLAAPLAVLAARNVGPRFVVAPARFVLNVIRTVPALVWALFCVAAVGFGPAAGVVALAAYSLGYLTKFFYESLESTDRRPQEALAEIGAGGLMRFRHAVLPAALPMVLSSCLFMLEYNIRAASVLGIVDAGGIGWHIKHYLDYRNFPAAMACLVLILIVVIALDAVSNRVRAWAVNR